MVIIVKHPVCFYGKDYPKGTHDVPDEVFDHPFFDHMVKDGKIIMEGDSAPLKKQESVHERNVRLAKKIELENEAKKKSSSEAELENENDLDEGDLELDDETDDDDGDEINFDEPESLTENKTASNKKRKRRR